MVLKGFKRERKRSTQSRSLITHINPRSPIAEQYRTMRTNIQFTQVDQTIRSLMVTSSGPAEGKSTTVANLAVVFAQQGKKVLVVDADMRKPTVHYTFRLNNTLGLTNILTKQATLEEAINDSLIENLFVMTSGPVPPNPAELLGSSAMENLLAELYKQFDLVIFDTPPVLAVTDAQILANQCNGTILVVSSGKTEIDYANKSKELLLNAKGKLLGVVLNNKKDKKGAYYYYYGGK
ncbi:MAG TPA: CpsD/CapB family tyrosine-protein kinase [Bacillus sp. (in: firmicutes)]|uniref:CpsD/CapB family tyrosine-protein kinase n=1 Tax=Bacillus litorisediminis TaxID=2922713 RepID=UPI002434D875|nr:CpsD/CapB family tyrosine-protein kinase [Bacillus litorisediminis]HWO77450.1 CpsD/CapB family tyrosine-protein kinase [Bacillus sp. (in: firmicutes)]